MCPHGFSSPAACVDCMYDGPVGVAPPSPEQILAAGAWVAAKHEGHCARRYAHRVAPGDPIGFVEGVGWCCEECAR